MRKIYLIAIFLICISCSDQQEEAVVFNSYHVSWLDKKTIYEAGESIVLHFNINGDADINLMLTNAFGSSTVLPVKNNAEVHFAIPKSYSRKSGPCNFTMFANGKAIHKGFFKIVPQVNSKPTLETYFGPRSVTAGVQDYSMLICVTTDPFD